MNNITQKLIQTQKNLKQLKDKFEKKQTADHNSIVKSIERHKNVQIDKLEEEIRRYKNEYYADLKKENTRFDEVKERFEKNVLPLNNSIDEMELQLKLYSIKNNLQKTNKVGWMRQKEINNAVHHTCKIMRLAAIHVYISEPHNSYSRKVNKFDVKIEAVFFNHKLNDMFKEKDITNWSQIIIQEKIPSLEAGMTWLAKNYDKAMSKFITYHDELVSIMDNIKLDLAKEFDFRLLEMNYSTRHIIKQTKNILVVEYDSSDRSNKSTFEITHVGQLSFNIAAVRSKNESDELRKKSDEAVVLDLLNTNHPLGLTKDQVKFHKVKPSVKVSHNSRMNMRAKSILNSWR